MTSRMIAHIKLLNGEFLEMIIEGKGMAGGIWIGDPKLGKLVRLKFRGNSSCNV